MRPEVRRIHGAKWVAGHLPERDHVKTAKSQIDLTMATCPFNLRTLSLRVSVAQAAERPVTSVTGFFYFFETMAYALGFPGPPLRTMRTNPALVSRHSNVEM